MSYQCFVVFVILIKAASIKSDDQTFSLINKDNNNGSSFNGTLNSTLSSIDMHWPVLLLSVFPIFGTIGNYLVCCAILRDHSLQTKTNYYLFSLAISDLAVSLFVAPLSIVKDFLGIWVLHSSVCILWLFLDVLLCTTSIYHLAVVSILRFIAIQNPLKNNLIKSRSLTLGIIVVIWILSILISSNVLFLGYINSSNVLVFDECYLRNATFILYGSIFSFVIPIFIMTLMFILMARKLRMQLSKLDLRPIHSTSIEIKSDKCSSVNSNSTKHRRQQQHEQQLKQQPQKQSILRRHAAKTPAPTVNNFSSSASSSSVEYFINRHSVSTTLPAKQHQLRHHQHHKREKPPRAKHVKKNIFYRISFYLMKLTNDQNQKSTTQITNSEMQSETKALQVLVIVLIVFIVSWLPYCLVNLASIFMKEKYSKSLQVSLKWLTYLGYCSSALNPLIYTSFNKKFRKNFIEILLCVNKKPRRRHLLLSLV